MAEIIGATIIGIPELQEKLSPRLAAGPARDFLNRWAIFTQSRSREKAPVDRGNLRANIDHEIVEGIDFPEYAAVGTNVTYAPMMEGGTGVFAELEGGTGTAHWPPSGPLEAWALRHGMPEGSGASVAKAIGVRGGLKPRRFLRDAAAESEDMIPKYARRMADDIERNAAK